MAKFHVRRLPFMFPVVIVLSCILWKWANGSDSADPHLDCRIGRKVFADGSSHSFTSIRKLGNRRRSERLRCFDSSKGTHLALLITLAGDIETNLGPSVVFAKKYCKVSDKVIECIDCEKRFHAKCSNYGAENLLKIETGNRDWYCTNCKDDCGLYSGSCSKGFQLQGHCLARPI